MHWLDWLVLVGYAATILSIGWFVSRGTKTAHGHLRAARDLPAWAVVFSVLAAEVSAATYIGVPESGFRSNWNYMQFAIGALLGKWVIANWFVRLYWRLDLDTVYGFLGQRVGPAAQKASAWAFLAGRLIASGVRLFIAALAFKVVTGLPLQGAIAVMAVLSTTYTFFGGLKAVVWTDVAQGSIFFIGAVTSVIFGLLAIGQPVTDVVARAYEAGQLQFITFDPGPGATYLNSLRPLPVAILGGFFLALATHGTDQESVQHMLNTRSEKSSGLTVLLSGLFTFPIVAAFLSVGTVLWAYYQRFPPGPVTQEQVRDVFPDFIIRVLPIGIRGLVFSGLFAAAIGSLGATLNALTAAWANDIAPRRQNTAGSLVAVRILICVFGLLLALVALFFAWYARQSNDDLVQIALKAMTILYGGILGSFLVALLFKTRGSDLSVTLGMVVGVLIGGFLCFHREILGLARPILEWPYNIPIAAAATLLVAALGRRDAARMPATRSAAAGRTVEAAGVDHVS